VAGGLNKLIAGNLNFVVPEKTVWKDVCVSDQREGDQKKIYFYFWESSLNNLPGCGFFLIHFF
jgi:hypothetical protein